MAAYDDKLSWSPRWNTAVTVCIIAALALIVGLAFAVSNLQHKTDNTNKRLIAVMNCYENTAYSRTMLDQCIDDYFDSRGW